MIASAHKTLLRVRMSTGIWPLETPIAQPKKQQILRVKISLYSCMRQMQHALLIESNKSLEIRHNQSVHSLIRFSGQNAARHALRQG